VKKEKLSLKIRVGSIYCRKYVCEFMVPSQPPSGFLVDNSILFGTRSAGSPQSIPDGGVAVDVNWATLYGNLQKAFSYDAGVFVALCNVTVRVRVMINASMINSTNGNPFWDIQINTTGTATNDATGPIYSRFQYTGGIYQNDFLSQEAIVFLKSGQDLHVKVSQTGFDTQFEIIGSSLSIELVH
jgi:hypothetical protein